jgi:pyruvate dehydrogenase E2 component (dihydrolipoamide acetyltransferase)
VRWEFKQNARTLSSLKGAVAMSIEVIVPVMGENIKEGQVVHVAVKEGDDVKAGQSILEIETGKATVEVPSPAAGKVEKILVKAGDRVDVKQLVMMISGDAPIPETTAKVESPQLAMDEKKKVEPAETAVSKQSAVVVAPPQTLVLPVQGVGVACAPSVRRFARELGVSVADVASSHPRGRVTIEDVKAHVKKITTQKGMGGYQVRQVPLPDFTKFGDVREEPMSTIRTHTAEHMATAWATIPHVTQHARARVDALEMVRKKLSQRLEKDGVRLTVTAFLVKSVATVLKKNPKFNSSIDVENKKIIYKDFVNIGVAVDTDRGLLVPVVRDADKKTIGQIAKDLASLSEKARTGKLSPDDMSGGTFTISNLGSIGGGFFTPIVNAPEVAILGVSRTVQECVPAANGSPEFAAMLPLSLSYDHRLIDGADGARFVMALVEFIEDPSLMLLN